MQAAQTIIGWCTMYGYGILRYPGNLRRYAAKQLPDCAPETALLADVVSLPGAVDCLMWCRYYASDQKNLEACTESYTELIRAAGRRNAADLEHAFRLLSSGIAGV